MPKHVKNLLNNIKKEKLLSISNIFIMTVTFLLLGLFITIVAVSQTALRNLERQAQITIFFKDETPETQILERKSEIEKDGRVAVVNYISKEQAFVLFTELNKDEPVLLESVTSSILPASLEVKAKNLTDMSSLVEEYNQIDGVEEVKFYQDVVSRFRSFSVAVYVIGFILVAVFFLISYSIIIATVRTTINSKKVELEILKLVGATDTYVKTPLVFQGTFYGLVSSLISGILLLLITVLVRSLEIIPDKIEIGFLNSLSIDIVIFALAQFFVLLLSGFLLGYFGSSATVKKYLKY